MSKTKRQMAKARQDNTNNASARYRLDKLQYQNSFDAVDPTEINRLVDDSIDNDNEANPKSSTNNQLGGMPGSGDIVMNQAEFNSIPSQQMPPNLQIEMKDRSSPTQEYSL